MDELPSGQRRGSECVLLRLVIACEAGAGIIEPVAILATSVA
jgi:hypothetical protein